MKRRPPPLGFVRCGAVSLPIRYSPVKAKVHDPSAPRIEGQPPKLIEKTYESFIIDARSAGRGQIRAASIEDAQEKGKPIAKALAKEGEAATELTPAQCRIYALAEQTLAPFKIAVDEGARRLGEMLKQLGDDCFQKVHDSYQAGRQKLKVRAKTSEIYDLYLYDQEVVRGNGEYHLRDVKRHVGKFVEDHPAEILKITTEEIDGWLSTFKGKVKTKNNPRDKGILDASRLG